VTQTSVNPWWAVDLGRMTRINAVRASPLRKGVSE
jgi:hypothetical protein